MRARQHRQIGMRVRQRAQVGDQLRQRRKQNVAPRGENHAAIREVVDVLGGAREVDEFAGGGNFGSLGKAFLQPILHRLDVVIGRALDRLDALGVGEREVARSGSDRGSRGAGKRLDLGDPGFVGERLEPRELDPDALANESVFAEVFRERCDFCAVAPVQRRESSQRRKRVGVGHDSGGKV